MDPVQIRQQAQTILETARTENRALTAEETQRIETLIAQAEALEAQQAIEQRILGGSGIEPQAGPATPAPAATPATPAATPALPAPAQSPAHVTGVQDPQIHEDPNCGFRSAGEYMRAVHAAAVDPRNIDERLAKINAATVAAELTTRDSESRTFAVPMGFRPQRDQYDFNEHAEILGLFNIEDTTNGEVKYVKNTEDDGMVVYWDDEKDKIKESEVPDHKKASCKVNRMSCLLRVTNEKLRDEAQLANEFNVRVPRAMDKKTCEAFLFGNGVAKPLGMLNSKNKASITVAKETGQANNTIVTNNLLKMYLHFYGGNGLFLANRTCLPQIATMTLGDKLMWLPGDGALRNGLMGTLLGERLMFSDYAKLLGAEGDINWINPTGYRAIRLTGGVQSAFSQHMFFDTNESAFRYLYWVGGQPVFDAEYDPAKDKNGLKQGSKKAHVVKLAKRN